MKLIKLAPLAIAMMLSGCAVGPDYTQPTSSLESEYLYQGVKGTQAGKYAQQTDNAWWKSFEDPTLDQLVIDAQNQAIPLKIAAQRIRMAQSYQSTIESFKVPTVNIGAGFGNFQISENDPLLGGAITAKHPVSGEELGSLTTIIALSLPVQPLLGKSTFSDELIDKPVPQLFVKNRW